VVPEGSARGPFLNDTPIGLDANHRTICRFASEMGEFQTVHRQLHMRLCDIQEMPGAIWSPPRVDDFDELMEALRPRSGRVEGNTSSERIKSPAK
jgi:hypothetical protein